ncbi:hypothetical protein AB4238_02555 [Shewanella sp. 10N.286.45.A1]|uniref:hypothetical protein n=1 Tax=Shewanella sp. 10N.286.45.A1 TaxID=3229694 RepID=UPI00354C6A0E
MIFNTFAKEIGTLVSQILAVESAEQGSELLCQLLILLNGEQQVQDNSHGTTGLILSSQNAANCLLSYSRTLSYWRALCDAVDIFSDKAQVNIVYPGPGPIAALVLPLWLAKGWKNINLTLLEYNSSTATRLQEMLLKLGLSNEISIINCDASQYEPECEIDILIMECMTKGLADEGQYAISTHLCQFMSQDAVLIPETITLDLHYGFLGQEFKEIESGKAFSEFQQQTRLWSVHLMSLDKQQKLNKAAPQASVFLGRFQLPENLTSGCSLFISTNIVTFGQYTIPEYSCGLTVPYPIDIESGCKNTQFLDAYYQYDDRPGIRLSGVSET